MKIIFAISCLLCFATPAPAQGMKDPSAWTFNVTPSKPGGKSGAGVQAYTLRFQVALQPGWHIYALNPGGDGTLIPPSFAFADKNLHPAEMKEEHDAKEQVMEGVDGKVRYHEGKVTFYTTINVRRGAIIKGTYTYQLCNDMVCLPPKTKPFLFRIP